MSRGQSDVIGRLIKGVDWTGLILAGAEVPEGMMEHLDRLEYVPVEPVAVLDALDYASFLIRTTFDMQRFSDGTLALPGLVPGCGGPLQFLVVERDGISWMQAPTRSAEHSAPGT
jgi:hypothetical protein